MALFRQQGSTAKRLSRFRRVQSNVDPFLYVKKSAKGVVYVTLYIDDNFMLVDVKAIEDAISALKNN